MAKCLPVIEISASCLAQVQYWPVPRPIPLLNALFDLPAVDVPHKTEHLKQDSDLIIDF